jgi:hypothetical protein
MKPENELASTHVSRSRCIVPWWNCWVEIAGMTYGNVDDLSLDYLA